MEHSKIARTTRILASSNTVRRTIIVRKAFMIQNHFAIPLQIAVINKTAIISMMKKISKIEGMELADCYYLKGLITLVPGMKRIRRNFKPIPMAQYGGILCVQSIIIQMSRSKDIMRN